MRWLLLLTLTCLCFGDSKDGAPNLSLQEGALSVVLEEDDAVRRSFLELRNEQDAMEIVANVTRVVKRYCSLRRYQRALGLIEAVKPPALPPPFYAFKMAYHEAKTLSCYGDVNRAVYVLHLARDNLLKYLGNLDREKLSNYFDVWEAVYGFTSQLVTWYASTGGYEAGDSLSSWMVSHGPYRSKIQLPEHFIPELPLNPWPSFGDLYGFEDVKTAILAALNEVRAEFWSDEVQSELDYTYDTDCVLALDENKDASEQYWKKLQYGNLECSISVEEEGRAEGVEEGRGEAEGEGGEVDDSAEASAVCRLHNEISKKHHVHRISYNKISPWAKSKGHFGESNAYLNVLAGFGDTACLKVTTGRSEGMLKEGDGELLLFDDSFFTMVENLCDTDVSFLRIDVQHPQFFV